MDYINYYQKYEQYEEFNLPLKPILDEMYQHIWFSYLLKKFLLK